MTERARVVYRMTKIPYREEGEEEGEVVAVGKGGEGDGEDVKEGKRGSGR